MWQQIIHEPIIDSNKVNSTEFRAPKKNAQNNNLQLICVNSFYFYYSLFSISIILNSIKTKTVIIIITEKSSLSFHTHKKLGAIYMKSLFLFAAALVSSAVVAQKCDDWKPIIKEICEDTNKIVFQNTLSSYEDRLQRSVDCILVSKDVAKKDEFVKEVNQIESYCPHLPPGIVEILERTIEILNMQDAIQNGKDPTPYTNHLNTMGSNSRQQVLFNDFSSVQRMSRLPRVAGLNKNQTELPKPRYDTNIGKLKNPPTQVKVGNQTVKLSLAGRKSRL